MEIYTNLFLISYGAIGVFNFLFLTVYFVLKSATVLSSVTGTTTLNLCLAFFIWLRFLCLFWPVTFGIVIGFMLADGLEKYELLEKLKLAEAKGVAKAEAEAKAKAQ